MYLWCGNLIYPNCVCTIMRGIFCALVHITLDKWFRWDGQSIWFRTLVLAHESSFLCPKEPPYSKIHIFAPSCFPYLYLNPFGFFWQALLFNWKCLFSPFHPHRFFFLLSYTNNSSHFMSICSTFKIEKFIRIIIRLDLVSQKHCMQELTCSNESYSELKIEGELL